MPKSVHNDVLDAALELVESNCTRLTACNAQPTTFAEGNATFALADVTVDSSDFTVGDGDASGRKVAVAAQSAVPVDATGTATHVALLDVSNSRLLYVTTSTSQALTSGNSVNLPTFDIEIVDPT